jgi:hypothetical protein
MKYLLPKWYKNNRLDFAAITDEQLRQTEREVTAYGEANQKLWRAANAKRQQMISDACEIWGAQSAVVKYLRRTVLEPTPNLALEHRKFMKKVLEARAAAERRARRREYSRRYRERKAREQAELDDALRLEGATISELYQLEAAPLDTAGQG